MLNQYQDVFKSLQKHKVKYVVIGGIAVVLHGVPRATLDLDLLIEATKKNAQKLLDALIAADLGTASLTTAEQLLNNEITIFQDRLRIDVQTSTPGLDFKQAWRNRKKMKFRNIQFYVVSKSDLISAKQASGRQIDFEDIRMLKVKKKN